MNDLKEMLMADARAKGICLDGLSKMRVLPDKGELIDYYVENPDWCLERSFPDFETLQTAFANCGEKGVFVGRKFRGEVLNDLQAYIFHNCSGTVKVGLNVDKAIIPMLYIANNCRLRIVGVGDVVPRRRSEVPVYIFGRNDVSARGNQYVKFNCHTRDDKK